MPLPDPRGARVVVLADGPADPFAAALGECLAAIGIEPEDDVASADVVLACLPWRRLRDRAPGLPLGPDAVLVACTSSFEYRMPKTSLQPMRYITRSHAMVSPTMMRVWRFLGSRAARFFIDSAYTIARGRSGIGARLFA